MANRHEIVANLARAAADFIAMGLSHLTDEQKESFGAQLLRSRNLVLMITPDKPMQAVVSIVRRDGAVAPVFAVDLPHIDRH